LHITANWIVTAVEWRFIPYGLTPAVPYKYRQHAVRLPSAED